MSLYEPNTWRDVAMFGTKRLLEAYDELCAKEWKYSADDTYTYSVSYHQPRTVSMREWAGAIWHVLEMRHMLWFEQDGIEYKRTHKGLEVVPQKPISWY